MYIFSFSVMIKMINDKKKKHYTISSLSIYFVKRYSLHETLNISLNGKINDFMYCTISLNGRDIYIYIIYT